MKRILFICSGNMYRSAGAEFILRKKLTEAGIEGWTVDSAGTLQLGHARRPEAFGAILAEKGYDFGGETQYVREADAPSKHEILVSLAQRGIITYIPRSVGCSLTMTKEREVDLYLSPSIFEERQMRFISKINAMLEYAEQNQFCREQVLLAYFGERDAIPCGHCDVCIAQ